MSVSIDITAQGCEQEALLVSEARLEAAAELAGLAFCGVDFGAGAMFLEDGYRLGAGLGAGRHAFLAGGTETDEGAGEGAELLQLGAVRRASQGLCYETRVMVVMRTGGSGAPAAPRRSTVAAPRYRRIRASRMTLLQESRTYLRIRSRGPFFRRLRSLAVGPRA